MSDLLQRLKLGTDNVKLLNFPGSDQKVALKILSQKDLQDAAFATERYFKSEKIEVNLVTSEEYDAEKATQILYRCLKDPENTNESIASSITEFRKLLNREEKRILADEYVAFERECSPAPDNLSGDEFDKILSDLKKNPATSISTITSISTARRLITCLVDQLTSLHTVSGSTSSASIKQ